MDEPGATIDQLVADEPARSTDGTGLAGSLRRLCTAAGRSLTASGVGLSVIAETGMRGIAAVSEPPYRAVEELQFTLGEGPCLDAFTTRRPVLVPDLGDAARQRWPGYTPAVHSHGMRAVFAFPLLIGAARLGVLDVFRTQPGALTDHQLRMALTFADAAVTMLLDGQQHAPPGTVADGLEDLIGQGAHVYQAQGMVAVQLEVSMTDALARLQAHAYAEDRPLGEVARDIVARRLTFDNGRRDRQQPQEPSEGR